VWQSGRSGGEGAAPRSISLEMVVKKFMPVTFTSVCGGLLLCFEVPPNIDYLKILQQLGLTKLAKYSRLAGFMLPDRSRTFCRYHKKERKEEKSLLAMMGICFVFSSFLVTSNAFSTTLSTQQHYRRIPKGSKSSRTSYSSTSSATLISNTHPNRTFSASSTTGFETSCEQKNTICYPLQVIHQGRKTTINVHEDEPILQALERQSTIADDGDQISLALSHIPHECRRGNCLTCASKIVESPTITNQTNNNLVVNVDNGLSPTIASELTKSGYVLTCCSYITGPGVVLELDQNNEAWDVVYKQRLCDGDTKQVALEAQARLMRRVDEENVEKWKSKMKKVWSD